LAEFGIPYGCEIGYSRLVLIKQKKQWKKLKWEWK